MITQISRYLHPKHITKTLKNSLLFSTTKKIPHSEQLTPQQIQQLLGTSPKQKNPKLPDPQKQQTHNSKIVGTQNLQSDRSSVGNTGTGIQKKVQQQAEIDESKLFYGLMPLRNQNYPICVDPDQVVIGETPNQNIFKALDLAQNCSFNDYTLALSKFRTQTELYGDQQPKSIIQNNSLQFKQLLHPQSKYLHRARYSFMVNISIPGTIECQDPRKFMQLRPIEQFRHTPLIPISDSYMQRHKQMLERYHRKQFVFEVKKQSILNFLLVAVCAGTGMYMIRMILQKEEERTVNYGRLKYQRLMGESGETPVFRI